MTEFITNPKSCFDLVKPQYVHNSGHNKPKKIQVQHPIHIPSHKHDFQIHLDLDGVFADFNGMFKQLTGQHPTDFLAENKSSRFWAIINAKQDFFHSLDMIDGSLVLWEACKEFTPVFLTGAPSSERARTDKVLWVQEKFGHEWQTIVLPKKEKQLYSGPRKILIDDTKINIDQWVEKGGIGVFHQGDFDETIQGLKSAISILGNR